MDLPFIILDVKKSIPIDGVAFLIYNSRHHNQGFKLISNRLAKIINNAEKTKIPAPLPIKD